MKAKLYELKFSAYPVPNVRVVTDDPQGILKLIDSDLETLSLGSDIPDVLWHIAESSPSDDAVFLNDAADHILELFTAYTDLASVVRSLIRNNPQVFKGAME